ncbi:WD40 repeat domain-containing protein [Rhodococcus spelaei]|uniref:WD40 repeat domain-containing protein n=1 Tax=Rhodococcus spelaei TaxID=2546320 RepID=A0A541BNU9_9NOCA|nr:WD40 repeat domain-containing protein [Rhodococcus spelaei]TQF74017.1 WD40 repeat domain-containing protein [Rhodococcus spelaei]
MTDSRPGDSEADPQVRERSPRSDSELEPSLPSDPSTQARLLFADQMRLLFATAGRPALKTVVSESAALGRALGADKQVSVQRLSDWRSGKRVPASFDSVRPVLVVLIRAAQELHGAQPPAPGLYSVKQWHGWWRDAREGGAVRGRPESVKPVAVAAPVSGVRPYRGLEPYRAEDARLFFGRSASLRGLVDAVIAAQGHGLVIVTGASGVGKSSLVQAGLVPDLARRDPDAETAASASVVFTPGPCPLDSISEALPELASVVERPDREGVRRAMRAASERLGAPSLVIVVDQIEELFTQCGEQDERVRFLAVLAYAASALGSGETPDAAPSVVATMRSDFYEQALSYPVLAEALERRSKAIAPLTRAEMVDVITRPAQLIGFKLEAGLVDLILHDLGVLTSSEGSGTVLPLLSHLLDTMWERRRGGALTVASYRSTGGVRGSVAATAERTWEDLDEHGRVLARSIMVHLVYVTHTGTDVKIRRTLPQLLAFAGDDTVAGQQVVDQFIAARVLVADTESVELIHDAVIEAWPRLKSWIQEDRSYSALRQQIEEDAARWEQSERDSSLLYQRARLDMVAEHDASRVAAEGLGVARVSSSLTPGASEFLASSTQHVRRNTWVQRAVMAGLVVSTVIALVAVSMAWTAKSRAESERSAAQFRQVVALADSMRETDPTTAARLSLAAWQMRPGDDSAYSGLIATESTPVGRALSGHQGPVYGVAVTADGTTMASASDDRTVRLWDLTDRSDPRPIGIPLGGSAKYMASVSFTPDGNILAAGSGDGTVFIWDITDRSAPKPLLEAARAGSRAVHNIRFSPDGRTLAVPNDDGTVMLFDTSNPSSGEFPKTVLSAHAGAVRTVSFRADSAVLATASDDRTVRLWSMAKPGTPTPLPSVLDGFGDVVHSVAFSPDGRTLAASSDDGVLRLFDATDVVAVRPIGVPVQAHTGGIWTISFSPDGATLVSASWDGIVKRWAVDPARGSLRELRPALTGNGGGVPAVALVSDGETIVTGGQDSMVRVWTLPRTALAVSESALTLPSMSQDGGIMATGGYDSVIRLWTLVGGGRLSLASATALPRPFGGAHVVALSPNGELMATAPTNGGQVQVWDVRDREHPRALGEPILTRTRFTWELAFSPDGSTLAVGDDDTSVRLWNLADPQRPVPWGDALSGPSNLVRTVAFSPDGTNLVAADADGGVHAWDVRDRAHPSSVEVTTDGRRSGINSLSFSPDGKTMVAGDDDQSVQVWDRSSDGTLVVRDAALRGHTGTVYSVSFDPDGRHVVSGSDDGTVRLWDVSDAGAMREVGGPITTAGTGRWQVAFRPGTETVFAGDGDGVLRAWRLDEQSIVDRICSSTAELSPQRWTDFELSGSARGECGAE